MKIPVLDNGYIELVESWGSDARVIESARMSTDKGFLGWGPKHEDNCLTNSLVVGSKCNCTPKPGDEKLLAYLYDNKHSTPFEFGGITIEVQAPIIVFREWHRHRVPFGYSELSARYTPMPDLNYLPTVDRCMVSNSSNKQAGKIKGADELTEESTLEWLSKLSEAYDWCEGIYQDGLKRGIPKELARLIVPVGRYSRMRATGNLRGWLGFLGLRMAPNAQYEIRAYANEVAKFIQKEFPRTYELFERGQK